MVSWRAEAGGRSEAVAEGAMLNVLGDFGVVDDF